MIHMYVDKTFRGEALDLITVMNRIVEDYTDQGYTLTVRQLYYQLVARDHIPNTEKSYKRITGLVNDARLAGHMDWSAIEDRTREFVSRSHWDSPSEIVNSCVSNYHEDLWGDQPTRVFVIVEKEALVGVLEGTCYALDVPLLAARGYPSSSVLREFAVEQMQTAFEREQGVVILHLGDHDPSGMDMSRDLEDRLNLFAETSYMGGDFTFSRIALNMSQIKKYKPPENPAKSTDSRFKEYRRLYGASSWELDALSPDQLTELVDSHVHRYIDPERWSATRQRINDGKAKLRNMAKAL